MAFARKGRLIASSSGVGRCLGRQKGGPSLLVSVLFCALRET